MAIQDPGPSWFLAQLKPNGAALAEENLIRQGFQTFLPMEPEVRRRSGKFITAMRPLFPGYIFVAFDAALGLWRTVKSTRGVSRLVSFGKYPAAVPVDLVSQLKARCNANGELKSQPVFKPGDHVTLTRGAFANFVAEVERIAPGRRVWVLMDLMGSQTRVAVGSDRLRAI